MIRRCPAKELKTLEALLEKVEAEMTQNTQ